MRCRELEIIIAHSRTENVNVRDVHSSSLKDGVSTSRDPGGSVPKISKDFGKESKITEVNKIPFEI